MKDTHRPSNWQFQSLKIRRSNFLNYAEFVDCDLRVAGCPVWTQNNLPTPLCSHNNKDPRNLFSGDRVFYLTQNLTASKSGDWKVYLFWLRRLQTLRLSKRVGRVAGVRSSSRRRTFKLPAARLNTSQSTNFAWARNADQRIATL